jgi:hypothetical protein
LVADVVRSQILATMTVADADDEHMPAIWDAIRTRNAAGCGMHRSTFQRRIAPASFALNAAIRSVEAQRGDTSTDLSWSHDWRALFL